MGNLDRGGSELIGIVGYDLLARAIVIADPEERTVRIHRPGDAGIGEGVKWQQMEIVDKTPVVRAAFEGDHVAPFQVDTGFAGSVMFGARAIELYDLLEDRPVEEGTLSDFGGTAPALYGKLGWFSVGYRRFPDLTVIFDRDHNIAARMKVAGSIGSAILMRFRLVFDYTGGRIGFTRVDEWR